MATKSLGTLTLDLIAKTGSYVRGMTAAERASEKWRKQVRRDVADVSKKLAGLSVAGIAALGALTASTVRSAGEITRLSQVAGSSTREFQIYAAGAKALGIEQDKLADIFKDTSDKVGDFLQTGGGALADFFENIAPQVGVTAEQFRNLSGPQALGLYVSSLEKANVSQNEMTFFLEAIASDATLLLPLLKNNSEGFRALGDEAERAGAILSQDTIDGAQQLNAAMFLLDQNLTGIKTQISSALIPVLADLTGQFSSVNTEGEKVNALSEFLADSLKRVTASAVGAATAVQIYGKTIGGYFAVIASLPRGLDAAKLAFEAFREDVDATAQAGATRINDILNAGDNADTENRLKQIAAFLDNVGASASNAGASVGGFSKTTKDAADQLLERFKDTEDGYLRQLALIDDTSEASKLAYEIESGRLVGINQQQQERLLNLANEVDGLEKLAKAQEDYASLVKELRTDEERLTDQLKERFAVLEAVNGLSAEEYANTAKRIAESGFSDSPDFAGLSPEVGGAFSEFNNLEKAREQLENWYDEQLSLLESFRQERSDLNAVWDEREAEIAQEHAERLAEIEVARQQVAYTAAEDLFGNLAGITKQFAGEQSAAYRVLFAAEKAAAIARSIVAIQTAIAQAAASGPFPANLAAMASVAAATAGLIGTITSTTIQGQAHDGLMSVPKTGTYLLEKGERVTTSDTSAKLDRTLDDVRASRQAGGGSNQNIRIVNAFDTAVIGDYIGSSEGEKVIMNAVRRNQRAIRAIVA